MTGDGEFLALVSPVQVGNPLFSFTSLGRFSRVESWATLAGSPEMTAFRATSPGLALMCWGSILL